MGRLLKRQTQKPAFSRGRLLSDSFKNPCFCGAGCQCVKTAKRIQIGKWKQQSSQRPVWSQNRNQGKRAVLQNLSSVNQTLNGTNENLRMLGLARKVDVLVDLICVSDDENATARTIIVF